MTNEESDNYMAEVENFIRTVGHTDPIQIAALAFLRNWNPNVFLREIEGEDSYSAALRMWNLPENKEERDFAFSVGCYIPQDELLDAWDGNAIDRLSTIIVMARENREIVRNMVSFNQ